MLRSFFLTMLVVTLFGGFARSSMTRGDAPSAGDTASAAKGKAVFEGKCGACHSIGGGNLVGPDLKDVAVRRNPDWLMRFIREPDVMIRNKDPLAVKLLDEFNGIPMPNVGLSEGETAAVIEYLGSAGSPRAGGKPAPAEERAKKSSVAAKRAQATPQVSQGNAEDGGKLFVGSKVFQNGGAACGACHSSPGIGVLGGGSLGPDLRQAYGTYGPQGLVSALTNMPFPAMTPIYHDHSLTAGEEADLVAFLQKTASAAPETTSAGTVLLLVTFSVEGLATIFVLSHAVWRRRLKGVRRSLLPR